MSQVGRVVPDIWGQTVPLAVDEVIGALAGRQHGVVGRAQLLAAGITARAIEHRVETGRLHLFYRGVYAVGHRVLSQSRWMAAALATGGVLSYRAAGALWDLRPWTGVIEITTPRTRTKRPGLLLHRAVLGADEITTRDGIPVTTPARTQLDLAAVLQRHQLQHDRKLIVELDGYEYHQTRQAFEADRRRDRILAAAGWRVIRITWRDLDDPESLARELEALGP